MTVEDATKRQLADLGVSAEDNGLAAAVVLAAQALDSYPSARDMAGLMRELRSTMVELAKHAKPPAAASKLDDLRTRRQARLAGGS